MANHNLPTQTSTYQNFVTELDGRLDDLALGLDPARTTMTNLPTNAVGWSSNENKWKRWTGSAWADLTTTYAVSISGTASVSTSATVTTSAANSAFKIPFINSTANTTGNYGLLQDSASTFTYNPSTDTLTVANVVGNASSASSSVNTTNVGLTTNSSSSAFKIPFANTTANTTGNYNLLQESESTFTYNPSTNTLTVANIVGNASTVTNGVYTIGDQTIGGTKTFNNIYLTGTQYQAVQAVSSSTIDCSLGNYFIKAINDSITFSFTNAPGTGVYGFLLELTHTNGAITWPASVTWPNELAPSLSAGKTHLFVFVTDNGGSTWRGNVSANYTN